MKTRTTKPSTAIDQRYVQSLQLSILSALHVSRDDRVRNILINAISHCGPHEEDEETPEDMSVAKAKPGPKPGKRKPGPKPRAQSVQSEVGE